MSHRLVWACLLSGCASSAMAPPDPGDAAAASDTLAGEADSRDQRDAAAQGAPDWAPGSYGPKCTVQLIGGPPIDCISAGIVRHGDTTVLTFNFCWSNDKNICKPSDPVVIDGIFILPGPEWREGHFTEAGGFVDVEIRAGAHYLLAPAGLLPGTIPLDLRITSTPVAGGGSALHGVLDVRLPRVDRAGDPLLFRATIN